ncbi:hypothetical protein AtNW77_Chr4g0276451 [Arabidopsis thaliana]
MEGDWYYIADFHVKRSTGLSSTCTIAFRSSMWPTKMWHVSPISTRSFFDCIYPDELQDADEMGVITSVSKVKRFPYVCCQGESNYHVRYVTFNIKDNL